MNRHRTHKYFPMRWLGWLGCTATIAALSIFGRRLQTLLTPWLKTSWLAIGIFILLFLILFYFYQKRKAYSVAIPTLVGSLLLLLSGAVAVYTKLLLPVETVHFLIFFCFGWLSLQVFGFTYGIVAVFSMAIGDEILQHFLPDRVGDLHDMVINSLSGLMGLLLSKQ